MTNTYSSEIEDPEIRAIDIILEVLTTELPGESEAQARALKYVAYRQGIRL